MKQISNLESNSRKLRELIEGPGVSQILEAHNALSATIVEEAGIQGLWASSLTRCAVPTRSTKSPWVSCSRSS